MLKKLAFALSLTLVTLALAVPAQAQMIGSIGAGLSCFPFGCFNGMPSTRYQQVYDQGSFGSGSFTITDISFFNSAAFGNLNAGTYHFYLSTTPVAPDFLAGPFGGMDANVGGDNKLFGTFLLSGGAAPPVMTFAGSGFSYNSSLGHLLLDIQITGISHTGTDAFSYAEAGTANGMFSRMHDFWIGEYQGYGLVTEFNRTLNADYVFSDINDIGVVPEPGTVFLLATGLVALGMAARRRQKGLSI